MIIVAGGVHIRPETRQDVIDACKEVEAATHAEPGCISYAFHFGIADPDYLHVFERWESEAALNAHLSQNHTQAFLAKVGEVATETPVVEVFEIASKKGLF